MIAKTPMMITSEHLSHAHGSSHLHLHPQTVMRSKPNTMIASLFVSLMVTEGSKCLFWRGVAQSGQIPRLRSLHKDEVWDEQLWDCDGIAVASFLLTVTKVHKGTGRASPHELFCDQISSQISITNLRSRSFRSARCPPPILKVLTAGKLRMSVTKRSRLLQTRLYGPAKKSNSL